MDLSNLVKRATEYSEASSIPVAAKERLQAAAQGPSRLHYVQQVSETLYAHAARLDDEGKDLVAEINDFTASRLWPNRPEDNRAVDVAKVMREEKGKMSPSPSKRKGTCDDPACLVGFS